MDSSVEGLELSMQTIIDKIDNIRSNETLSDAEKSEKIKTADEFISKFLKLKQCERCQNFFIISCNSCMKTYLENRFEKWTSDEPQVDELIQYYQKSFVRPENILEWIPYEDLQDTKYVSEGGLYFKIKALWVEGKYVNWDIERQELKRNGPQSVTIKYINTNNSDQEQWKAQWLYEIKAHLLLSSTNSPVIRSFGLTKDDNSNFMIVTENVAYDLKKFLQDKIYSLNWLQKYKILLDILESLGSVHKNKLIHGDLHPGVIWYSTSRELWVIGDFRFCRPVDNPANESFGTMPYVAPEMLGDQRGQTTNSSDIYSFAMIMWEIATHRRPFFYTIQPLDSLSPEIAEGLRPKILDGIPRRYSEIMINCWDNEPSKRTKLVDVQNQIKDILNDFYKNNMSIEEQDEMKSVFGKKITEDAHDVDDVKPNVGISVPSIDIFEHHHIKDERFSVGKISFATVSSNRVAIKTLPINISDKTSKSMISVIPTSLQEEVSNLNNVYQHNNIVKFLGVGIRDQNKLFLVMPIANGGNLRDFLKANKLPLDKKIGIAKNITSGIMKLHEANIVHENINPKNILIFDEIAKISNLPLPFKKPFEIKAFKNKDLYVYHDLFDNIGYIDPNWFLKGHDGGYSKVKSVDIYSLGTLLWEIMSEKVPYQDTPVDKSMNGGILGLIKKIKTGYREKSNISGISKFPDKYINLYENCWVGDSDKRPTINEVHELLMNIN